MARERGKEGFTLVEILIVVTIIIMVFGFAMPTIGKYLSNQKLKAVTGRLARGVLIARTRAITKHDDVYVIFFPHRLMIVSARPRVPEFYDYFTTKKEAAKMTIRLRFANAIIREKGNANDPFGVESDLSEEPEEDWTQPITGKEILQSGLLTGKTAYLLFHSDGTVEFGSGDGPGDRLSTDFWAKPPRAADIIVEEQGNTMRGWIDIRATGNVESLVKEGTPKYVAEEEKE